LKVGAIFRLKTYLGGQKDAPKGHHMMMVGGMNGLQIIKVTVLNPGNKKD
jgi:hypothetical protein